MLATSPATAGPFARPTATTPTAAGWPSARRYAATLGDVEGDDVAAAGFLEAHGVGLPHPHHARSIGEDLSLKVKGGFSTFFWGCWRPLWTTRSLTIWILSVGLIRCPSMPAYLRGSRALSGPIWDRANRVTQVCHLERIVPKARSPNWPYGRLDRAPLSVPLETTLGAPRRARRQLAKGGRTDRWPQMIAIPSRTILLMYIDSIT